MCDILSGIGQQMADWGLFDIPILSNILYALTLMWAGFLGCYEVG